MEIQEIALDKLRFDDQNPRLRSVNSDSSQLDLLRTLYSEMSVDEVALSIAENGFFPEEPLLVIEAKTKSGKAAGTYIVVEGNRRLAAVQLLVDDALRKKIEATDLPKINAVRKDRLQSLPCIVYDDRQVLWQFLGFRHINGVKPWDAYSKANYVADVHEKYDIPLPKIAQSIGDRHSTVTRLYRGLVVLRQAEQQGFNRDDRARNRFYFSHLYTALDQPEFQRFLKIDGEKSLRRSPVPASRSRELKELMTWLYGSKSQGREPVVRSQNPDLNKLRETISQPAALSALRKGTSLDRSHEISIGDERRFVDSVYGALEDLKQAIGLLATGFKKNNEGLSTAIDQVFDLANRLKTQAEKIK